MLTLSADGKGRFRDSGFDYRINDVSRYGKHYIGVLHVSGALKGTQYIVDASENMLQLTHPEWWSSLDNDYHPVPDADTYTCRRKTSAAR